MLTRTPCAVLLATAALATLTSCSGGSGSSSAGSVGAAPEAAVSAPKAAGGVTDGLVGRVPGARVGAARTVVRARAVIRIGTVSLTSTRLSTVRAEIDGLLASLGGSLDSEHTTNDRRGRVVRSTLVVRVPVARFETARHAFGRLGTLASSTESGSDVTTEVIDTAERVQTLTTSLNRLQRFQRTARDVGDLLRYEDQITSRQAELQSLKAQQTYLSDQTSMSTITLRLSTPHAYVAPPGALDHAGFLTGLRGG